jgi:hypothetical protein
VVPDDPHSFEALWLLGAGSTDEAALRADGVRVRLGEMLQAAFAQGVRGLADATLSPTRDTDAGGSRGCPTRASRSRREPATCYWSRRGLGRSRTSSPIAGSSTSSRARGAGPRPATSRSSPRREPRPSRAPTVSPTQKGREDPWR